MTWYAVPNDEIGGWAVANRQVPTSQLVCIGGFLGVASTDEVIADMVKSEDDARRIAAALNVVEVVFDARARVTEVYSLPWPTDRPGGSR